LPNRLLQLRDEWAHVHETRALRGDDYDSNAECRNVLLMLETLVHSDENFELGLSLAEKSTVAQTCPTLLLDGANLEFRKFAAQQTRDVLVE